MVGVLRHGLSQEGEISDGSIYSKRYWKPASAQESLIEKFWRQRFSYKMLEASAQESLVDTSWRLRLLWESSSRLVDTIALDR